MEVRCALYIPTYEYNYKVITGCDTILQEYYITHRRKYENTKGYTMMNSTKCIHELQEKNSRNEQRTLEEWGSRRSADDPRFSCASLIGIRENSQAQSSGI